MNLQSVQTFSSVNESLKDAANCLKQELQLIMPFIAEEIKVRQKEGHVLKNSMVSQFSVTDVDRFIELLKDDLYIENKKLIENLNLVEKTKRLPRLEKYLSRSFSYYELVDTLLFLKNSHDYNLDTSFIIVPSERYTVLEHTAKSSAFERCEVKSGVLHLYNIPIYSDKDWPIKYKCLPSNLIIFGDSKQKIKVYADNISVTKYGIDYYKICVPKFTPFKLFSIKV